MSAPDEAERKAISRRESPSGPTGAHPRRLVGAVAVALTVTLAGCGRFADKPDPDPDPDAGPTPQPPVADLGVAADLALGPPAKDGGTVINGFVHPGILVNQGQLDLIKARIAAGQEPQKSALAVMQSFEYFPMSRVAGAVAVVLCGPAGRRPILVHTNEVCRRAGARDLSRPGTRPARFRGDDQCGGDRV